MRANWLGQLSVLKGLIPLGIVLVCFEAVRVWQISSALGQGQVSGPNFNVTYEAASRPFAYRISLIGWTVSGVIGLALIGFAVWLALQVVRNRSRWSK